eukprot:gene34189-41387_t
MRAATIFKTIPRLSSVRSALYSPVRRSHGGRFDWPHHSGSIAAASTPPSSWYLDPQFLSEVEQQHTFKTWLNVARADQLQREGDYLSLTVLGQPILITRGGQGQLKAFYNVCRHHAAQIVDDNVQGSMSAQDRFVCPYHGWEYNVDGRLTKAHKMKGCENFSAKNFGLNSLPVAQVGLFIYVNFSPSKSQDIHADLPDLQEVHALLRDTQYEQLRHVHSKSYELDCNWKVFIDNYLDGGYHVSVAHPALAAALDLQKYTRRALRHSYVQACPSRPESARLAGGAEACREALYIFQYPNVCVNRYGQWLDTNIVFPLGAQRCRVLFDWFAHPSVSDSEVQRSLRDSEVVQQEDIFLCERVQKGLRSDGYEVGRYAPSLEGGEFLFHQLLHRDYLSSRLSKQP